MDHQPKVEDEFEEPVSSGVGSACFQQVVEVEQCPDLCKCIMRLLACCITLHNYHLISHDYNTLRENQRYSFLLAEF